MKQIAKKGKWFLPLLLAMLVVLSPVNAHAIDLILQSERDYKLLTTETENLLYPHTTGWSTTGVSRHTNIGAFLISSELPEMPADFWGTAPTGNATINSTAGAGTAGPGNILQMPIDYLDLTDHGGVVLANFRQSAQGQGRTATQPGAMAFMAFNGLRSQGGFNNSGLGWNPNAAGGNGLNLTVAGGPLAGMPVGTPLSSALTVNIGIGADLLQGAGLAEQWPLVDTVLVQASHVNGNPFLHEAPNGAQIRNITIESGTASAFSALSATNPHTWDWPATVNNTAGLAELETIADAQWRTVGAVAEILPGNVDTVFVFHLENPVPIRYLRANIEIFLPDGHTGAPPNIFASNLGINTIEVYNTQAPPIAPTQPELELTQTTIRHFTGAITPVMAAYRLNGFSLSQLMVNEQPLTYSTHFTSSIVSGVQVITFTNAFIDSLSGGNHLIQARFSYGMFEENVSHTLDIHYLTGKGWNTVPGLMSPTGVLQFPSAAAFLASSDKPNMPLGFWGTAPIMPGATGAGRTGPENLLHINFSGTTNVDALAADAFFRRSVTGQQLNPITGATGSHSFMAFNGMRTMGPFLNSGIGWNTSGAAAQNLARPGGTDLQQEYIENAGIAADLLQGAPAHTPWPLVDTVVLHAAWANTGAPLTASAPPAARIGQIAIESGTAPAFTALSATNGHTRDWPSAVNNSNNLATLETADGAQWSTVGYTVTIQPGNTYTVFVFHLAQPVPMRYVRASVEMILPPGHAGGAGTFPASIGINFIEIYNTQMLATRPWFLPSESTRNHFAGSDVPAFAVFRENGFAFSHILVGGRPLRAGIDFTTNLIGDLQTITFKPAFLETLELGDHVIETHFIGHTVSLNYILTVFPAESDTPAFTPEAVPIVTQPITTPVINADIVVPNIDGTLTYTTWSTHDSLARGTVGETGHELLGNIMPDFSGVGFREGREDIPFLDSSNSYVYRLHPNSIGDDTERINAAITHVGNQPIREEHGFRGVVELASGTFRISGEQGILLNQSGVVLRGSGQGPDGTILLYTHRPGDTVLPNAHIFRNLGVAITMGTSAFENLAPPDGTYAPGVIAGSGRDQSITFSNPTDVAPGWYPVGTNRLTLTSTIGFYVGDRISLLRTPSRAWVDLMNLTSAGNWGFPHNNPAINVGEGALNYRLNFERVITAIEGNEIVLNLPLVHGLNIPTDDTAVVRLIDESNRVINVGVENLRIVAARDQENLMNINRGRTAVRAIAVRDAFVRDTTSIFFPFGHTNLYHNATNISVLNNSYLSPAVELTISARLYAFTIDHGTNSLFDGNYAQGARYEFVTGATVAGPNVFLDGVGEASRIGSENHHRWATGTLFDNIRMLEGNDTFLHAGPGINPPVRGSIGQIRVENRGSNGTGQGWTATSTVFWNPVSDNITYTRPPTGQNFVVGRGGIYPVSVVRNQGQPTLAGGTQGGGIAGPGGTQTMIGLIQDLWDMYGHAHVENINFRVNPGSLYRAQVSVRETGEYWNAVPGRPFLQRPMPDTWVDTSFVISGLHDPEAENVAIYINGDFHDYATLGNTANNYMFTYHATLTPGYHSIATAQTVDGSASHLTALRFVNVRQDGVYDATSSGFVYTLRSAATQNMLQRTTILPPTIILTPDSIIVDDVNLVATLTVEGVATGQITLGINNLPTGVIAEVNQATGVITITAERPAQDQPPINGVFDLLVTREGVTAVLTVNVNLTPQQADGDGTIVPGPGPGTGTGPGVGAPGATAPGATPASGGITPGEDADTPADDPENHARSFVDINYRDWFYDAVRFVGANGLMQGVSEDSFAPNAPLTRAMLVTILHRVEGEPEASVQNPFIDVAFGRWYTDAITWASEKGIVEGFGDGRFAPSENITREQIATILMRFADWSGIDTSATTQLDTFIDAYQISHWALDAKRWANAEGLITGRTETTLVPRGNTTRAEAAMMLMRFMTNNS